MSTKAEKLSAYYIQKYPLTFTEDISQTDTSLSIMSP